MTTFLGIEEVNTSVEDDGLEEVTVTARRRGPAKKHIMFPTDLDKRNDSTSESGFEFIPYVKLSISEIRRDGNLPGYGRGDVDLSNPTSGSVAGGLESAYDIATSTVGKGFIAAGIAAQLGAGELASLGAGVGAATLEKLGIMDQVTDQLDAAVSDVLGVSGTTIGDQFKTRLKNFSLRRNVDNINTHIILPMPENIGVAYDQQYLEVGLTQALGLPGLLTQSYSARNSKTSYGKGGTDPYIMEMASAIAQNVPGVGAGAERILFFGTTGLAVNPQLEMLFTSSSLRKFVLDFRLTPRNRQDAEVLFSNDFRRGVIAALKYYSAPEIPKQTTGRYFIPPAQFEIEFYRGLGYKNYTMFKTKKCVLTSVAVDYTPNGFATHEDGAPAQVSLQLNFSETSILSREDYAKGIAR